MKSCAVVSASPTAHVRRVGRQAALAGERAERHRAATRAVALGEPQPGEHRGVDDRPAQPHAGSRSALPRNARSTDAWCATRMRPAIAGSIARIASARIGGPPARSAARMPWTRIASSGSGRVGRTRPWTDPASMSRPSSTGSRRTRRSRAPSGPAPSARGRRRSSRPRATACRRQPGPRVGARGAVCGARPQDHRAPICISAATRFCARRRAEGLLEVAARERAELRRIDVVVGLLAAR